MMPSSLFVIHSFVNLPICRQRLQKRMPKALKRKGGMTTWQRRQSRGFIPHTKVGLRIWWSLRRPCAVWVIGTAAETADRKKISVRMPCVHSQFRSDGARWQSGQVPKRLLVQLPFIWGIAPESLFLYANLAFFEGDGLYEMCLYGYRENE